MAIIRGRKVVEECPWVMNYINQSYNAEILVSRSLDLYKWECHSNFDDRIYLLDSNGNELGRAGNFMIQKGVHTLIKGPLYAENILGDVPFEYSHVSLVSVLKSLGQSKYDAMYALRAHEHYFPRRYTLYKAPQEYRSFGQYLDTFIDGYNKEDLENTYAKEKAEMDAFFSDTDK